MTEPSSVPSEAFHTFYNSFPGPIAANRAFTNRDVWFKKLAPLFSLPGAGGRFELCLIHRHVQLKPGERMVSTGLVMKPELVSDGDPTLIPERWTSTGEAFEFRRVAPGVAPSLPPAGLIDAFRSIAGEQRFLGIALVRMNKAPNGTIWTERTDADTREHTVEARTSATAPSPFMGASSSTIDDATVASTLPTAWQASLIQPSQMDVCCVCYHQS